MSTTMTTIGPVTVMTHWTDNDRLAFLGLDADAEHAGEVMDQAVSMADELLRPTVVLFQPDAVAPVPYPMAIATVVPFDTREQADAWAVQALAADVPGLVATVRPGAAAAGPVADRDPDAYAHAHEGPCARMGDGVRTCACVGCGPCDGVRVCACVGVTPDD